MSPTHQARVRLPNRISRNIAMLIIFGFMSATMLPSCRHDGPGDAEVDQCINTMKAMTSSDAPAGERSAKMAAGCARIYAEPECQQAHEKFGEGDPSQKARILAERCAHAYCDKLDQPKPTLCTNWPPAGPMELFQGWAELRQAIWKRDLGEARTQRLLDATKAPK
jgi:hypothetical protein